MCQGQFLGSSITIKEKKKLCIINGLTNCMYVGAAVNTNMSFHFSYIFYLTSVWSTVAYCWSVGASEAELYIIRSSSFVNGMVIQIFSSSGDVNHIITTTLLNWKWHMYTQTNTCSNIWSSAVCTLVNVGTGDSSIIPWWSKLSVTLTMKKILC